jgi:hypothetical protein
MGSTVRWRKLKNVMSTNPQPFQDDLRKEYCMAKIFLWPTRMFARSFVELAEEAPLEIYVS